MRHNHNAGHRRILLYYQGYCAKCRILSKTVVVMSLNFIKRIPLERDESIRLFFEDYPRAKGYPILFLGSRPVYNYWVFPAVPLAIVLSWYYRVRALFSTGDMAARQQPGYPPFLSH
jgi:hypothetical protein